MIHMTKLAGSTSQSVVLRFIDSTDGTPETGVTSATSGLDLEYWRSLGTSTDLTESDLAATTTAFAAGGMKHVGNGYYRVDVPDAAFAAGVPFVLIHGACSGMIIIGALVELFAYDPYTTPGTAPTNFNLMAISGAGVVQASLRDILGTAITETAGQIAAAFKQFFDVSSPTGTMKAITNVVTATNLTTNNDKTGYRLSSTGVQDVTRSVDGAFIAAGTWAAITTTTGTVASGDKGLFKAGDQLVVLSSGGAVLGIAVLGSDYSTSTGANTFDPPLTTASLLTGATYSGFGAAGFPTTSVPSVALTSAERTTLTAAIWAALVSGLTTVGSIGKRLVDNLTGDIYARLGAPAGASTAADIAAAKADTAAIKLKTDNLPGDPADASDIASSFSTVNSTLSGIAAKTVNLPSSPAATSDIPTATQNADALLGRNIAGGSSLGRTVTSALRKLRNKVAIVTGTMTVYQEDDSTVDHTETVTTASGDPISSTDPDT